MVASEAVAIKFHIPQRSTLSPVIHTLYDNSFHSVKHSSIYVSTALDIDGVTFINLWLKNFAISQNLFFL